MLRTLLKLRAVFPTKLSSKLIDSYWRKHWAKEQARETLRLGRPAPELDGAERAALCEAVAGEYPFGKVLELGCGFGQTFDLLAPLFPDVSFFGVDIDAERVSSATELANNAGRENVAFKVCDARDLSEFSDGEFDLVISSAALLFLTPEGLALSLKEVARVGSGCMIFLEQHEPGAGLGYRSSENVTRGQYWIRDWSAAVSEALPQASVVIRPVTNPLWTTEKWQDLACVVEIRL